MVSAFYSQPFENRFENWQYDGYCISAQAILPGKNIGRIKELFSSYVTKYQLFKLEICEKKLIESSLSKQPEQLREQGNGLLEDRSEEIDRLFQKTFTVLQKNAPSAVLGVHLDDLSRLTPRQLLFFYEGKGDLFLYGKGFKMLGSQGQLQNKKWDECNSLTRVADGLWLCTLYLEEGQLGECKARSARGWSCGPNIALGVDAEPDLMSLAFDFQYSICLPYKIFPSSYKISLFGQGTVVDLSGAEHRLSWDSPFDLQSMGSALWKTTLIPKGDVEYKFCLVSHRGDIIWETGPNRKMFLTGAVDALPIFDVPDDLKIQRLSIAQIQNEHLIKEQMQIQCQLHEEMMRAQRVFFSKYLDREDAVIEIHDSVEMYTLDSTPIDDQTSITEGCFVKSRSFQGKWVIKQQSRQGCTAGCSAMMMLDKDIIPDEAMLKNRKGSYMGIISRDLKKVHLKTIKTKVSTLSSFDLSDLRRLVLKNGSACLGVSFKGPHGHAIIVDAISKDLSVVRFREPSLSLDISISGEAFLSIWKKGIALVVDYIITQFASDER